MLRSRAILGLVPVLCAATLDCAANPVRPECGGARLLAANIGTMMFGAIHCTREAAIDRCVAQGGDPAACRSAVFPPPPASSCPSLPSRPINGNGPRDPWGVPVRGTGIVPVYPVR